MIDFEYSLEVAKYLIVYPTLVITSLSAVYTFLVRTHENFQRNKSKSLDVRICKCGGLYRDDNQKTTKTLGYNHMEINGNLYAAVNGRSQISADFVDKGINNNNNNDKFSSKTEPKLKVVNFNNNQNLRSRNTMKDDSIVLRNVHNRHVVSAMKEMFEHSVSEPSSNVRTLSPARINHNRTPVKTNLLKYFGGECSPSSPSISTIKKSSVNDNDKVLRRPLLRNNRIKTSNETNRLSQCSISELLEQLNDETQLQELCKEFVETGPRGVKPSDVQKTNDEKSEADPVQLRQKSVSFESLPGSKRLSLYSSSPVSRNSSSSRPISTENLLSLRRSLSSSLSNPNLNDILTQEIYDAILQSKNFDTAISFDDLLHAEELSRCLSEYSITELLRDSNMDES